MRNHQSFLFGTLALTVCTLSWGADFQKGFDAYNSGDYQTAIAEWQPLADAGQADGEYGMGLLYANGFGVPMADDQAVKWYQLAADQGHAEAQCNLAVMHANGWGVPQSDEEALKWYSLAADQGVAEAQINVAKMYMRGLGVEQSRIQAQKWFGIAAALGNKSATFKRDELAERMSSDELAEAETMMNAWMQDHLNLQANH